MICRGSLVLPAQRQLIERISGWFLRIGEPKRGINPRSFYAFNFLTIRRLSRARRLLARQAGGEAD
jgi:hypothetical protein